MEAIQEQFKKPAIIGVAGLVVGLILGIIYAWVIDPVEWTDAAVHHLRADLQEDYLRMSIDSFEKYQDVERALFRWGELGEEAEGVLALIEANPVRQNPQSIAAFKGVVTMGVMPEEEEEAAAGPFRSLLPIMCGVVVVLGLGLFALYLLRQRQAFPQDRPMTAAEQSKQMSQRVERTDYASIGEESPIGQFMTTYMLGDDLFDDSFSIDSPAGEFLGECGIGISETIDVGDPKRVTAFEIWLFDKNDIQTVTKVLMSQHAYLDEEIRQRLAAKGEPVLAEPGSQIVLNTATLRLVARVVDMAYGDAEGLPDDSFLERITLELAVWPA
jgi:hypothetical protein